MINFSNFQPINEFNQIAYAVTVEGKRRGLNEGNVFTHQNAPTGTGNEECLAMDITLGMPRKFLANPEQKKEVDRMARSMVISDREARNAS